MSKYQTAFYAKNVTRTNALDERLADRLAYGRGEKKNNEIRTEVIKPPLLLPHASSVSKQAENEILGHKCKEVIAHED